MEDNFIIIRNFNDINLRFTIKEFRSVITGKISYLVEYDFPYLSGMYGQMQFHTLTLAQRFATMIEKEYYHLYYDE